MVRVRLNGSEPQMGACMGEKDRFSWWTKQENEKEGGGEEGYRQEDGVSARLIEVHVARKVLEVLNWEG